MVEYFKINNMTDIQTKEIKGLNLRHLYLIIIGTIITTSTVLITKNSIENKIVGISNDQATYGKINDMNFKIYDAKFNQFQNEIDVIKKDQETLREQLKNK